MSLVVSYLPTAQPRAKTTPKPGTPKAAADDVPFQLRMVNQSAQPWVFYVYQSLPPAASADWFSLPWFASPFKIQVGNQIAFRWQVTYDFVWSASGKLIPGVTFDAGGGQPADPDGNNNTTFSDDPDSGPGLSAPQPGDPSGTLLIKDARTVPNNTFSVGIGMSGTGTHAVQAGTNLTHAFTPTPTYFVAAGSGLIQLGTVLSIETITQSAEARFPPAVKNLIATLGQDNTWTVAPDPNP